MAQGSRNRKVQKVQCLMQLNKLAETWRQTQQTHTDITHRYCCSCRYRYIQMPMQMEMETTNERTTNERCAQKNCQTFVQFNGFCCINPTGNICYAIAIYRIKWRRLLTMRVSSTFPKWKMASGTGIAQKVLKIYGRQGPSSHRLGPSNSIPCPLCATLCCTVLSISQSDSQSGILAKES